MKIIIWSAFVFVAALWTGGVALMVALLRASASLLQSADAAAVSDSVSQIPIPDWLAPWVDVLGWQEWVQGAAGLLDSVRSLLPTLGQSIDWILPAAWVVWGIGLMGLLILTVIGSRLMTRFVR
jgi:hypothetical protein